MPTPPVSRTFETVTVAGSPVGIRTSSGRMTSSRQPADRSVSVTVQATPLGMPPIVALAEAPSVTVSVTSCSIPASGHEACIVKVVSAPATSPCSCLRIVRPPSARVFVIVTCGGRIGHENRIRLDAGERPPGGHVGFGDRALDAGRDASEVAVVWPSSPGTLMVRSVSYRSPGQSTRTVKFWVAPAMGPTARFTMSIRPVSRRFVTVTAAGAARFVPMTTGLGVMSTSSHPSAGASSLIGADGAARDPVDHLERRALVIHVEHPRWR